MDQLCRFNSMTDSWQGRIDDGCLRLHQVVKSASQTNNSMTDAADVMILGYANDQGAVINQGRAGAKDGPGELRWALANTIINNPQQSIVDLGDATDCQDDLNGFQSSLIDMLTPMVQPSRKTIFLGGSHDLAKVHGSSLMRSGCFPNLAIVNFDAHLDIRPKVANKLSHSGSPFLELYEQAQSLEQDFHYYCIGMQPAHHSLSMLEQAQAMGVQIQTAQSCYQESDRVLALIDEIIGQHSHIYISLCMDVFAQAFAPGVSAPQALGLTPWQVFNPFLRLIKSGRVVALDVAEIAPCFDLDHRTAKLGASFVSEFINQ